MGIYEDTQAVAQDVLGEFKQGVIQYVKITKGSGPVDDPGASTPSNYTINATASGVSMKYVNMNLAVASDLQIIAPVDIRYTPDVKDAVIIDGVRYKIVHIEKKPAAGTAVAYLMIVRRGG